MRLAPSIGTIEEKDSSALKRDAYLLFMPSIAQQQVLVKGQKESGMSAPDETAKTIVIRDRRKPNQYTTDNTIAREWLPILRVGDAFLFYSVYLSMANRETESSWSSLRTLAKYLQCGIDLIIRGNKLLEICELIHIETGDHRTSNEYFILDPPSLTPELAERIYRRLDDLKAQEASKNWQAWVRQVRRALDRHRSLTDIWAERRARRGGRPVKTVRPPNPVRESQAGFPGNGDRESQAGRSWPTTSVHVTHDPGARDSRAKQGEQTRTEQQGKEKKEDGLFLLVRTQCRAIGVAPQIVDLLLAEHSLASIARQLEWLPCRNAHDPAAMLVSSIQGDWAQPSGYDDERSLAVWGEWMSAYAPASSALDETQDLPNVVPAAESIWPRVLEELRLQMTRAAFDTWLGGSRGDLDGDEMIVHVRNAYAVDWLRTRWMVPLERTVVGILGRPVRIRFEAET